MTVRRFPVYIRKENEKVNFNPVKIKLSDSYGMHDMKIHLKPKKSKGNREIRRNLCFFERVEADKGKENREKRRNLCFFRKQKPKKAKEMGRNEEIFAFLESRSRKKQRKWEETKKSLLF